MIEMDVLEVIRTRRSIRRYDQSRDVELEKLLACLESARWAPSASNRQPWHFIVVRKKETREALARMHPYGKFMAQSPVVLVVLGDPQKHPKYFKCDPPIATQNFLLAAHAQGLGTCWMGVIDAPFEDEMKRLLGVPESLRIICTVSVGYPAEKTEKTRQPLEELVSYEGYGVKSK
nr:nitroreductase family protein [Candidatus Njordarchaeum guaymaensis]